MNRKSRIWGIYGLVVGMVAALMAVGPWHVSGSAWAMYGVCVAAVGGILAFTVGSTEEA